MEVTAASVSVEVPVPATPLPQASVTKDETYIDHLPPVTLPSHRDAPSLAVMASLHIPDNGTRQDIFGQEGSQLEKGQLGMHYGR